MKIDDLITKYRKMSTKGNIMFSKRPDVAEAINLQYKETADLLEELKSYRENDGMSENVYRAGYKRGYNNGIDVFKEELLFSKGEIFIPEHCKAYFCEGDCNDCISEIRNVAEQLKLGDENAG